MSAIGDDPVTLEQFKRAVSGGGGKKCKITKSQYLDATVEQAAALDGEPLPETTMVNTIATAGDPENAATSTLVRTDGCCCGRISVTNTGANPVVISASPSLFVKRVC